MQKWIYLIHTITEWNSWRMDLYLGPDEGGSKRILWGIIWATDVEKIQESWNFLEEMKCFMRESSASWKWNPQWCVDSKLRLRKSLKKGWSLEGAMGRWSIWWGGSSGRVWGLLWYTLEEWTGEIQEVLLHHNIAHHLFILYLNVAKPLGALGA